MDAVPIIIRSEGLFDCHLGRICLQFLYHLSRQWKLFVVTVEFAERHLHGLEALRSTVEIDDDAERQVFGLMMNGINAIGRAINPGSGRPLLVLRMLLLLSAV